jgi:hypothetical protein
MALRGKRGGANRSDGMATREVRSFCGELGATGAGNVSCLRKEGHRGLHLARLCDGFWLEWRVTEGKRKAPPNG